MSSGIHLLTTYCPYGLLTLTLEGHNYPIPSNHRTWHKCDEFLMFPALVGHSYQTPTLRRLHGIGKGKVYPRTGHEGPEGGQMYSSTPPSTSTLMGGVSVQGHTLAALPPRKPRYPLYRRLGGPQGRSGRVQKISPPPGFDPRTVQSVASRYTD